jgi:hypothetical protein
MLLHSTKVLAPFVTIAKFWVGLTHPSSKCIGKYVVMEELKTNVVSDYEVLEHLLAITMQQVLPSLILLHMPNIRLMAGITQHINPMSIPLNPKTTIWVNTLSQDVHQEYILCASHVQLVHGKMWPKGGFSHHHKENNNNRCQH